MEPCIFTHFAVDNVKEKSLKEILRSSFFRAIRARQPYDSNLLLPCMLIDHPHVFREIYAEIHPYPTHPGAESLIHELASGLDDYARRDRVIMDRAWQEDFVSKGFPVPEPPRGNGRHPREPEREGKPIHSHS